MDIKERKHFIIFIFVFVIIFAILYAVQWIGYPSFDPPLLQHHDICMKHIKEWTLYSGDPYCFQSPISYIFAGLFSLISKNFSKVNLIFYFITLFIITYIACVIKRKETGNDFIFLFCFLFLFLFAKYLSFQLATNVAAFFLITGFYVLDYTTLRWKYPLSGLLFGLALFSKSHNTPLIVGPIILFHFYYLYNKQIKLSLTKDIFHFFREQKSKIIGICLPPLFLFTLLLFLFPGFINYNYIIHLYYHPLQSYPSIIFELVTFTYWYNGLFLLLYLSLFISLLRLIFYKKFDVFSFIATISFLVLVIFDAHKAGLYKLIDEYRYFLLLMPFYLINVFKFASEFREAYKKKCAILLFIFVVVLFYIFYITLGGLTINDFIKNEGINDEKLLQRIQLEVEIPLLSIPKQEGKILVYENYSQRYSLLFEGNNPFLFVSDGDFINYFPDMSILSLNPDMAIASNFVEAGITDSLEPYMHDIYPDKAYHTKQLQQGAYSLIIYGSDERFFDFLTSNNDVVGHYCSIRVPFLVERTSEYLYFFRGILFKDFKQCNAFLEEVNKYYRDNFDVFCQRGKKFIEIIQNQIERNGIVFDKKCNSNKQLILVNSPLRFQALFFSFLLTCYLVGVLVKGWKREITSYFISHQIIQRIILFFRFSNLPK